MTHHFQAWRHRRPFGAGLLTAFAGAEILLAPVIGVGLIINTGLAGTSGFLLGIVLIGLGLAFWAAPAHRTLTAVFTIATAFAAFLTTNLGGFLIGHLLALTGAAAGIAWTPPPKTQPLEHRGEQRPVPHPPAEES